MNLNELIPGMKEISFVTSAQGREYAWLMRDEFRNS